MKTPAHRSTFALTVLLLFVSFVAACATPVGVKRVGTREAHHLLTASVLSTGTPSEHSVQVLSRLDLTEQFEKKPEEALATLHAGLAPVGDEDRLFALAELSFLHAEQSRGRSQRGDVQGRGACVAERCRRQPTEQEKEHVYYLAAAVYAYAFLFPEDQQQIALDPADPRLRLAYDLYNRGVSEGFASPDRQEVLLTSGRYKLPFGTLEIESLAADFTWVGYRLEHFVPAADLAVHGLRNRYRRPGIGAPLAASLAGAATSSASEASRIPPRLKVPVTAFLRLAELRHGLATGSLRGQLELYASDQTETVTINNQQRPLEVESTAALAYTLQGSRAYEFELAGFLRDALRSVLPQDRAQDGLVLLHPPRLDRIPLVLVHGTASSPARWAELVNELESDLRIREHYQIWLFMYDTGNPIGYSAGRLRQALQNVARELDPEGTAPALKQMVVIGHSQGGLLTKLTAIRSGTHFWDNISRTPFDQLKVESETRELLRRSLFFEPLPFVKRVIFISTPHRGSYMAALRAGRLASWLVSIPGDLSKRMLDVATLNQDQLLIQRMKKPPTSIDNMNPSNPFIKTLAAIPVVDGVVAHSIIPVQGDGPLQEGSDGIVKYESAHIEGVASELVVHFGHSVQSHPKAIEEVRRILLEHLEQGGNKQSIQVKDRHLSSTSLTRSHDGSEEK